MATLTKASAAEIKKENKRNALNYNVDVINVVKHFYYVMLHFHTILKKKIPIIITKY